MKMQLTLAAIEWWKLGLTVIITVWVALVILKLIELSKEPLDKKREAKPGALQTGLGVLLVCLSLAAGFYIFMFYDVTVQTRAGSVVNLAKNSERMILLGACGVGVIVGTLMGVVGTMRQGAGTGTGRQSEGGMVRE